MKKLMFILCILSVAACHCDKNVSVNKSSPKALTIKKITLNGVDSVTASKRVRSFQSDTISSDPVTSIWFSQAFIDNIYSVLQYEGGDGIRIYFAKRPDKRNTIVIVSTYDGGPSPAGDANPSERIHNDYFEHSTSVLSLPEMQVKESYDPILNPNEPCPPAGSGNICNRQEASYLSCDDAHEWIRNFKGEGIVTKSVWYNIKMIKKIKLELIAAQAVNNNIADGVRIYFAKDNGGKNTFVFVTTKLVNGVQVDYHECFSNIPVDTEKKGGNDHGEECPVFCNGTALP